MSDIKTVAQKLCNILYRHHGWKDDELYISIDKYTAKEIWNICRESEENKDNVKDILGDEAYQKVLELRPKYNSMKGVRHG